MKYWGGNYDVYRRTREEQDTNQVGFRSGIRAFFELEFSERMDCISF